jgi:L-amino acid N-acyltransferase YncA
MIRDSSSRDCEAIATIYAHYVLNSLATFDEIPLTPDEMAERRARVVTAGLPFLVASSAPDRVEGFAYASPYRHRSGYRFTLEDSIYVDPFALRRGIGSALLGTLIERCTALGYRQLVAVIGDSANAASIAVHSKLGFAPIGTMPAIGFKHRRWVDSVLMQRALGPGATTPPQQA